MYKVSGILVITVGVLLSGLWLFEPQPAGAQIFTDGGSGLQQFAGTYWAVFEAPGFPPLPAIVTAHPDGTSISVDGTDEGLGGMAAVNSAQLGVFKRSGPFQTTGRSIFLSYVDTLPVAAIVGTTVSNWNRDFSAGSGVLTQRVYDLTIGENPLDPNQGTPVPGEIPFQFGRLTP